MSETTTNTNATSPTCKGFVGQGWSDHADDAEGVMARLPEGLALATEASDLSRLAGLITHVAGEHLGRWGEGLALLDRLLELEIAQGAEASEHVQAVQRSRAVLLHCAGEAEACAAARAAGHPSERPEVSTHARVLAVAAAAFTGQGRVDEALATFRETIDLVLANEGEGGVIAADDPVHRALAITGNNLACELEETSERSAKQDALLELAALTARARWELAGTWSNVKVAEYRLAMTYLALARPEDALAHATLASELCAANEGGPDDRFFVHEALARCHHACGNPELARAERDAAAALLPEIDPSWGTYPAEALAKLDALLS